MKKSLRSTAPERAPLAAHDGTTRSAAWNDEAGYRCNRSCGSEMRSERGGYGVRMTWEMGSLLDARGERRLSDGAGRRMK